MKGEVLDMAVITYLGHSGFAVRTGSHLLIFDYLGKGLPEPRQADRAIAFVSHAHADHNHPSVRGWFDQGLCRLCVGEDVPGAGVERFAPGDSRVVDSAIVRAFGSTDQGVSFWVESGGLKVFHAGDFNLWHWRGDGDEAWTRRAEAEFYAILAQMEGLPVDVAFFPVDPRMKEDYAQGAMEFAQRVRPRLLFPMHFWDKPQAALDFAQRPMPAGTRALALVRPGQQVRYEDALHGL